MSRSKFNGIRFPFYGIKRTPYDIKYSSNSIKCNFIKDHKYFYIDKVDEITKNYSYLERLVPEDDRLYFDYTCRNLTELINSPVKWGVDNSGRIYNLSIKERFPISIRTIRKIKENLIWLTRISHPFILDKTLTIEEVDIKVLKVMVVYIDNTWILYKFTYDAISTESILL